MPLWLQNTIGHHGMQCLYQCHGQGMLSALQPYSKTFRITISWTNAAFAFNCSKVSIDEAFRPCFNPSKQERCSQPQRVHTTVAREGGIAGSLSVLRWPPQIRFCLADPNWLRWSLERDLLRELHYCRRGIAWLRAIASPIDPVKSGAM